MNVKYQKTCRICSNPNLSHVIDLGDQHLQGCFDDGKKPISRRKILNRIVRCDTSKYENACGLVQSSCSVPPEILYSNYFYQSSISNTMKDHLKKVVSDTLSILSLKESPKLDNLNVLDIGMNDGFLLDQYPDNFKKVGVDPSNVTRKAKEKYKNKENFTILNETFPSSRLLKNKILTSKEVGLQEKLGYGCFWMPHLKFDIISSIACFYDLEDPNKFCESIYNLLNDNGIWIFEVAYLPDILNKLCYDTMCNEHLEHYHLSSVEYLLNKTGLKLFKADRNSINGGSIRAYVCKKEDFNNFDNDVWGDNLQKLRFYEFDLALDEQKIYDDFQTRVFNQRNDLLEFFSKKVLNKHKICHLYGASTKANTLLQYCFGDNVTDYIEFAAERSMAKIGAKTLNGIKIISEEESRSMKPDYYLIGPWHFRDEIVEREKNSGIKLIFPLPKLEIV